MIVGRQPPLLVKVISCIAPGPGEPVGIAARAGLVAPRTRARLVTNALVIVAPAGSPLRLYPAPGFALAQALAGGKLAMGDPAAVPAGRYGKAALERLGVWSQVQGQVARAENVRATR